MYSDQSFIETISQWIVWGIPIFLIATFSILLKKVATLDADHHQEPTKTSKNIGTTLRVIGASLILYNLCAPVFYTKYIPPTLSGMYTITWFSMLFYGYGTYFKNLKESPRSNWTKVSKIFAHICALWVLDVILSEIYFSLIPGNQFESNMNLYIVTAILAVISVILFWLSYRHLKTKQTL